MNIATKIKEVLDDGNPYTVGEIWQLVNGAKISKELISISDQSNRLRKIVGNDFIGRTQLERSVRGLAIRGSINETDYSPKIFVGDKTYLLSTPISYYHK